MDTKKNRKSVAVVGLGYIGIPFTAALANVGYHVVGVDVDEKKIAKLQKTYTPDIHEPGVNEVMQRHKASIEFTTSYQYAMEKCSVIFITVGTPLKDNNEPDYSSIDSSVESIASNLKKGQVVVLKSTVVLGTTEDHVRPILEKISGLKAGVDFYLAFCPERTIEGLALHEIYNLPKIVGGINPESSRIVAEVMAKLGSKVIVVSRPIVAEMCKLIDNLYRSVNIAFANEIGIVCERLGLNAHETVAAVNHAYARNNMFTPGLGADGPCLSKDPMIFRYSALKYGIVPAITEGCIATNNDSTLRLATVAHKFVEQNKIGKPKVALVGLAFKGFPETDDIRGSPALKIKKALLEANKSVEFSYYDPIVRRMHDEKVQDSISECVKDSDVVIFLTNHPRIMDVDSKSLVKDMKRPCLIIDSWKNVKNYEDIRDEPGISVFRIGVGQ
jgi:nucleotide sugar dehydrogenase